MTEERKIGANYMVEAICRIFNDRSCTSTLPATDYKQVDDCSCDNEIHRLVSNFNLFILLQLFGAIKFWFLIRHTNTKVLV